MLQRYIFLIKSCRVNLLYTTIIFKATPVKGGENPCWDDLRSCFKGNRSFWRERFLLANFSVFRKMYSLKCTQARRIKLKVRQVFLCRLYLPPGIRNETLLLKPD